RRQRDRSAHARPGPLRRRHDFTGRRVKDAVVKRFEPDPDILAVHSHGSSVEEERATARAPDPALHLMIDATTPAPTVRPPSRMAKRSFSSMAIGTISVTSIATLSPGITISTPSGSDTTPVTSVVRK